jgi:hypothetical protein
LAFFACNDDTRTDLRDKVFVESFIYFGQVENNLEIRLFTPLSRASEAPFLTPQSTRIRNVSKNVEVFPAFLSNGKYVLNSGSLFLGEEDILELTINYEGETVMAKTTVPSRPTEAALSEEELKINYIVDAIPDRITLSWLPQSNPDYYMFMIDTVGDNHQEINPDRINFDPTNPYINLMGQPIASREVEISFPSVRYFGDHRLILFHITKDYYDLYNNPVQGTYNVSELSAVKIPKPLITL